MAQATPTNIFDLLAQPMASVGAGSSDELAALLQTGQQAVSASVDSPTDSSSKVTVTTKKPTIERPTLPSQTSEGQKVIASVDNAMDRNTQAQAVLNFEGQAQLAEMKSREAAARDSSTSLADANTDLARLIQANKVQVAKDGTGFANRFNSIVNDSAKNEALDASMASQMELQKEMELITADNSVTGVFKQLFVMPGKRRDFNALQAANLKTMQMRGMASTNYFNNMQAQAQIQENTSAEEMSTIAVDQAAATEGYKDFIRQGTISDTILSKVASASNLSAAEASAFNAKMGQLMKKDAIVMGDFQAAIESTKLEVAQSNRKKVLGSNKEESVAWAELQAQWERFEVSTGAELPFKEVKGLKSIDPKNPIVQRFDLFMARTGSTSRENPWATRLRSISEGTHDSSVPTTAAMDRRMSKIIQSKNKLITRSNSSGNHKLVDPLDANSTDPKMIARIDAEIRDQMKADSFDISDSVDNGSIQFTDLNAKIANTPEADWPTTFPSLDARDLAFIKSGGMKKLPTAIMQRPSVVIPTIIRTMVEQAKELEPAAARELILRQSNILGKLHGQQFENARRLGYSDLTGANIAGIDSLGIVSKVGDTFNIASPADWVIHAMGAYVQTIRSEKLQQSNISDLATFGGF